MAESRKLYTDADYLAFHDGEDGATPVDLGYYQRTNLEDIINNFIVAYIGPDKMLNAVPRHEVAFWAQRAVQEFSYDIFHANKAIELELDQDTLQVPLPQDFVSLVKLTEVRHDGREVPLYPANGVMAKRAILQDDQYIYEYDMEGNLLYAEQDEGTKRFQQVEEQERQRALDYYHGQGVYDDEYNFYNLYANQGRRYGLEPQRENINGEYVLDLDRGMIYFGSKLQTEGTIISLRYVSDGLADNGDLTQVYVPKLAEDALYASILYNLAKLRPSAAPAAGLYQKEARAKMRNAKIRLTDYKMEEMTQVMRGKSKWIKH